MAKPITVPNTFATQNGPIPLSQLDADFSTVYASVNDPATYTNYLVDSGSANVIVVQYATGISYSAYKAGDTVTIKLANGNGGATTLNINSLGAKSVVNHGSGTALALNQLISGGIYSFTYDGTNFQLNDADWGSSPIWTGNHKFNVSANGTTPLSVTAKGGFGIVVTGASGSFSTDVTAGATSGSSFGSRITGGTTSADNAFLVRASGSLATLFNVRGDGLVTMNEATLGTTNSALNAATYESGTFTATLTGMTATTTGTINWIRVGNIVSLYAVNNILGTSNSTSMTLTGIPASIQPANPISCDSVSEDNGTANIATLALITAGTITFFKITAATGVFSGANFTNSGTKGLNSQFTMVYPIQ